MFYNENQKIRYIEKSGMREDRAEGFKIILNTATKVELQEDMDLAFFTRNQVINLLKAYNSRSKKYLGLVCKHFSNYYEWCMEESIVDKGDVTNWYDVRLSKPIIDEVLPLSLIEDKYFNKEMMMTYLDDVIDVTNKFILYAPFVGIDGSDHEDLKYLKIDDIDSSSKTVMLHSGKVLKIDKTFYDLAHAANAARKYDKNGMGDDLRGKTTYAKSKYILKICEFAKEDTPIGKNTFIQRYGVIKEQTGNKLLNAKVIYKNGLINYIKEYFSMRGVSLRDAIFEKTASDVARYKYAKEFSDAINEFGSVIKPEFLRMEIKEIIDLYE